SRRREPPRRPFSRPIPPRPRLESRAVGTRHASRDKEVPMISVALTMALIMPVLLATGIAHAAENRYGMATAPPYNATMVVLTEYSDDESYVITVARMGRLVVSESGATTVAYDMGAFHALDGPENALVESPIADVVVTARGVRWMEFPAHVDTEPPLA